MLSTSILIQIAEKVYKTLGRFYSSSVYIKALAVEFTNRGIDYEMDTTFELLYNTEYALDDIVFDIYVPDGSVVHEEAAGVLKSAYGIPIKVSTDENILECIELFKNNLRNSNHKEGYIIFFLKRPDPHVDENKHISVIKLSL